MKVIKRDGRFEDYDISKIKRTICNASDDINKPLTEGDLKNLGDLIDHSIRESFSESVPSNEIRNIIESTLRENGFSAVASSYTNS
ncbi:ATP cone domain-containing protein [Alloiococcus sp. CFN-8]|uniref:ATP cone domain-containing protein n=1 Tax=Alloiococcus sp. CFN-8 TaxID=3416081 RepID=UPI003CF55272